MQSEITNEYNDFNVNKKRKNNNFVDNVMNANIQSLSMATSKKKSMQDLLNTSVNSINSILNANLKKNMAKKVRSDSKKKLKKTSSCANQEDESSHSTINEAAQSNHNIKQAANKPPAKPVNFKKDKSNSSVSSSQSSSILFNIDLDKSKKDDQDWQIIEEIRKISSINVDLNKKIQENKPVAKYNENEIKSTDFNFNDDKSTISMNTMNTNINSSSQDSKETKESKSEVQTANQTETKHSDTNLLSEDKKEIQKQV